MYEEAVAIPVATVSGENGSAVEEKAMNAEQRSADLHEILEYEWSFHEHSSLRDDMPIAGT